MECNNKANYIEDDPWLWLNITFLITSTFVPSTGIHWHLGHWRIPTAAKAVDHSDHGDHGDRDGDRHLVGPLLIYVGS